MNSIRAEAQNFFATAEADLEQGIVRVQKALETVETDRSFFV